MTTKTETAGRYWNPELMRTYYAAENRGWLMRAAQDSRDLREQGAMYAVYESKWHVFVEPPLVASDDLAVVQQFLRR